MGMIGGGRSGVPDVVEIRDRPLDTGKERWGQRLGRGCTQH